MPLQKSLEESSETLLGFLFLKSFSRILFRLPQGVLRLYGSFSISRGFLLLDPDTRFLLPGCLLQASSSWSPLPRLLLMIPLGFPPQNSSTVPPSEFFLWDSLESSSKTPPYDSSGVPPPGFLHSSSFRILSLEFLHLVFCCRIPAVLSSSMITSLRFLF